MKNTLFFLLSLSFLLTQCATPQKKLEKQDYEGAYKLALRQLKANKKNYQENQRILVKALEKIVENQLSAIQTNANSADVSRMEKAISSSETLMDKIQEATPYIHDEFIADFQTLDQIRLDVSFELYDFYLKEGLIQLEKAIEYGQKKQAQAAYIDFKNARKYIDEQNTELDSLEALAIEYGQVIYQVEAEAPFELMYQWEIDRRFEDVVNYSSTFYKIFYEGGTSQIDCRIELRFGSLRDNITERSQLSSFEQQIEDGSETVTDTSGNVSRVPIYRTVRGSVTTITKTKTLTWEADAYASGNSNCDVSNSHFSASRISEIEEYRLEGDERAIPDQYKNRFEQDFENENDMAAVLLDQIYQDFLGYYF